MTRPPRELNLPHRPYMPGQTERPPDALFEAVKRDLSPAMNVEELAASPAFRGGLAAFSARYYWEAHELWEGVWMCLPPAAAERHVMRGIIQLANAGLKARMGRPAAAARIRALARTALDEGFLHGAPAPMGLTRDRLTRLERQVEEEDMQYNANFSTK